MKEYIEYMDSISVTPDLHARIIDRVKQAQAEREQAAQVQAAQAQAAQAQAAQTQAAQAQASHEQATHEQAAYAQTAHEQAAQKAKPLIRISDFRRYAAPLSIAAACMVVVGLTIFAAPQLWSAPGGKTPAKSNDSMIFDPDDESFRTGEDAVDGGQGSGIVELTLEQAKGDADFGAYVSLGVPSEFRFASAQKSTGQIRDSLSVMWKDEAGDSDGSIAWRVSMSDKDELERIVYANEREKYDTSLYSFPWETSVPEELQRCFESPVFLSDELTLDTLLARAYHTDDDQRDTLGIRMDLSVLYGDVVVLVNTKGMSPQQLYEMLMELSTLQASNKQFEIVLDTLDKMTSDDGS